MNARYSLEWTCRTFVLEGALTSEKYLHFVENELTELLENVALQTKQ